MSYLDRKLAWPDTVSDWIVNKVAGGSPPSTQAAARNVVDNARSEVQKCVDEANNWLASLTQKVQSHGSLGLAVVFESSSQFTSAFTWNFDLANTQFVAAWNDAVHGDFVSAMGRGAATLESGSGYEQLHNRNTALSLSLFGLATFASVETYFSKSTLRYDSGVFYLETETGKVASISSKSHSSSTSVYLDGTAQSPTGDGPVTNVRIQFHGILTTYADKGQFARMGRLAQGLGLSFQAMPAGPELIAIGSTLKSLSGRG
jgi:hypothetical protein